MSIKHLKPRTIEELETYPFWKRSEAWKSPLAILLVIGYVIYGFFYGIIWVLKWLIFSWMRPFSDSIFFCNISFHKYREIKPHYKTCIICNKEKRVVELF
jgi:uncharacterized membrane protein